MFDELDEADERAEPYAQIADQIRFLVRRERNPGRVRAWLADRLQMIAAAQGRRIAAQDYEAIILMQGVAMPVDADWLDMTGWLRGDGRPDTPEKVKQRRADLVDASRPQRDNGRRLDARERAAVGEWLRCGLTPRQIAERLGITTRTVIRYKAELHGDNSNEEGE